MNRLLKMTLSGLREYDAERLTMFWAASGISILLVARGPLAQGLDETVGYL